MTFHSLRTLLPAAVVGALLAVAAATSLIHIAILSRSIEESAQQSLAAEQANIVAHIDGTFQEFMQDVVARADSGAPAGAVTQLSDLLVQAGPDGREALRGSLTSDQTDGSRYRLAYDGMRNYFASAQAEHGYYDVFVINRNGDVLFTLAKERDLLGNVLLGELSATGLSRAFSAAIEAKGPDAVFADYLPYAPSDGALAAFIAAPIHDDTGQTIGVYAVQVPNLTLPENRTDGLEVTVIGSDNLLRMSQHGQAEVPLALGSDVARSAALAAALDGETGVMADQTDEAGRRVAIAYAPLDLAGSKWAISTSIPQAGIWPELARHIGPFAAGFGLLALAILAAGGLFLHWVGLPASRLAAALREMPATGTEAPLPGQGRKDEIGQIARHAAQARAGRPDGTASGKMPIPDAAFDRHPMASMVVSSTGEVIRVNAAMTGLLARHARALAEGWPELAQPVTRGTLLPTGLLQTLTSGGPLPPALGAIAFQLHDIDSKGEVLLTAEDTAKQRNAGAILDAIMANQVMLELDADARVLKANAHACRLYGYSTAEFEGLDLRRLMQDDGRNLPDLMARIARDGTVTERQHRRTKTGGSVWVDCTFNAMKDPQGGIDRITVVCVDVTEAVLRIEAAERNQQAHRAAQTRVVDALGSALSRLAEGDMTTALDDPFEPEYEMLRANFNTAVQQLDRALSGVVTGAANIRNGAAEITEAADDLSRRTESQAATLEETAAALDMLTASVKASALGADEADRAVTEAREHAESSGSVVVEAVAAMGEIEQSSRQIRQIIGVIDDIAFQTNLLALNAGVEAARAGDAGRGFAVVASEVRALAQRSSEAAREIKDLISASSRHVEKGVGLVGETGEALKAIVQGVSQIATRVSAIAQSARAQATGLSEINSGMGNMDQVTQQNAAMVEESTAASHSLRSEAEALAGGVAHFRLRGTAPDQRRAVPAAAPVLASAARQTRPKLAASAARPAEWEEF